MKRFFPLLGIASLVILSACSSTRKVTKKYVTLDTITVHANNNPIDIYRASATRAWDIVHTRASLTFDWNRKTANSREWILLHPYFYPADTVVLDAKGMQIDTVMLINGSNNQPLRYTYKDDQLKIQFNKTYQPADTIQLYLRYTAMPYKESTGGSAAITEDRGLYFINTDGSIPGKPEQIWTQGETESNSHWLITIDKPNTRFTSQIELLVPDTMQTLSNGALISSTNQPGHMREDVWKIDMPIQAYAVMFSIGRYDIIKDHWKDKEVNYYVEPKYGPYGALMFQHTPAMIDYFSKITGVPYPWNKYDQVVVRDYVSGAMENTTASLFGEFMNENAREIADRNFEDVVSHELFHQWFGDYVTCESWSNITVNESFANYSEKLWRYHEYGKAYADELLFEDLEKYLQASKHSDPPLVRFYYGDREDVFDRISYEKGGAILNYMNKLMGDAAFDKAMNIYLTKNALHSAEATNWRLAVEEATGQDWNWFFNEWYYHGGHPVLKVSYAHNDTALVVTVKQVQDSSFTYQLPMKAAVVYGNNKQIVDWNINDKTETYTYPLKNGQAPVVIPDCTHLLPGKLIDGKQPSEWLVQYENSDDYISKRLAVASFHNNEENTDAQKIMDLALNDKIPAIRQYALSLLNDIKDKGLRNKWQQQVQYIAINDGNHMVRTEAFDVIGNWKLTAAKQTELDALHDSSYSVAGAALNALYNIDSADAYTYAVQLLKTNPQANLEATIWTIIGKTGNDNDITLFEQAAPYVYGTKKFQFAAGVYQYLLRVKNDVSFDEAAGVIVSLIKDENIKTYRIGLSSFLFGAAKHYFEQAGNDKSGAGAHNKQRADLLKSYIQKVMDAEKDPDNIKRYKLMYKELEVSDSSKK